MNCPKCGAILEDDSKFCVSCGASVQVEERMKPVIELEAVTLESVNTEHGSNKSNNGNTQRNTLGIIVGTLLIVIGTIRIFSAGADISSASFGADFYTYTYQGIVSIAEILTSIEVSLGWLIVSVGAAIDVYSMKK